jgi:hypothetical protein
VANSGALAHCASGLMKLALGEFFSKILKTKQLFFAKKRTSLTFQNLTFIVMIKKVFTNTVNIIVVKTLETLRKTYSNIFF